MPAENEPSAFRYPSRALARRHGPDGYADYESFRPWLRDEFSFRCVYCLIREQWGRVSGEFDLEHFTPLRISGSGMPDYENLLYACHACNMRKGDRLLPDAAAVLSSEHARVYPDGRLVGLTEDASRTIRILCLNSPAMTRWRRTWIRIIRLAEQHEPELFVELMRYPRDLPNLGRRRAPENSRPEGIRDSFFARHERGELPDVYLE